MWLSVLLCALCVELSEFSATNVKPANYRHGMHIVYRGFVALKAAVTKVLSLTAQLFRDFLGYVARPFNVFRFKRDRGDTRMSAAAVLFREGREIVFCGIRVPGIRANGNFRTHRRHDDADRIARVRGQHVGYELVVS